MGECLAIVEEEAERVAGSVLDGDIFLKVSGLAWAPILAPESFSGTSRVT